MALLLPWCLSLMWQLAASGAAGGAGGGTPAVLPAATRLAHSAAQHLRVFLALKCITFALGGWGCVEKVLNFVLFQQHFIIIKKSKV